MASARNLPRLLPRVSAGQLLGTSLAVEQEQNMDTDEKISFPLNITLTYTVLFFFFQIFRNHWAGWASG